MGRGRLGRLVLVRAMVNEGARVHWDFMSIDGTKVHTADIIYTPLYSNNYPWVQLRHELIANHGVIIFLSPCKNAKSLRSGGEQSWLLTRGDSLLCSNDQTNVQNLETARLRDSSNGQVSVSFLTIDLVISPIICPCLQQHDR